MRSTSSEFKISADGQPSALLMMKIALAVTLGVVACMLSLAPRSSASALPKNLPQKPFSLPFNTPSSLNTWLFEQPYGNTVEAFNLGKYWYKEGQGLHFGIDLEAPCGTPIVAIADGVVAWVDNGMFGAGPHNLVLRHPDLGYASVYGHLLTKPHLLPGQPVQRGEIVAQSGDPDYTCTSRPHLHLEIRSPDFRIAYNPLTLIDADWNMLYSLNQFSDAFTKDLYHVNRWQSWQTQPNTRFEDNLINLYAQPWPPLTRLSPSPQTLPNYSAPQPGTTAQVQKLTQDGCCTLPWWSAGSRSMRYLDGPDGELASVIAIALDGSSPYALRKAPPAITSPDGQYEVRVGEGHTTVTRLADKMNWSVFTQGTWPTFSPDSKRLLWHVRPADYITGTLLPRTEIWIAHVDGSDSKLLRLQTGGSVRWLDDNRLLIVETPLRSAESTLSIYDLSTGQMQILAAPQFLRSLSVAPGGKYLMYYLPFQQIPAQSGVYLLETRVGAKPQKMPFIGGWRWRDATSIIYIPFGSSPMSLTLYDVNSGQQRQLTDPASLLFTVTNADWDVSPDGQHVDFVSSVDGAIYVITWPKSSSDRLYF